MGAFEVLRGDVNGDGEVNGLDVNPFVDAVLAGALDAAADINADGSVSGLDVTPFVTTVLSGGGLAGARESSAVQRAVGVAAPEPDDIDEGKRFAYRRNVERSFPMDSRIQAGDDSDARRLRRERMLGLAQHERPSDWHVAVDDALGGDTDWSG